FLHGLLIVDDKLAMAHGLEGRVPFLHNELVDFAQRVPARPKLRHPADVVALHANQPRPQTEKDFRAHGGGELLLRQVLGQYVGAAVSAGAKQGFSGPDASWFRGESLDYVRELLFRDDARVYEFLRPDTVQELVRDHLEGRENRRLLLWSLLNFEHW